MKSLRSAALLLLLVSTVAHAGDSSRPQRTMDAAAIQLALQKLGVVGNVLYVAAHPDDENTAMLAWLANERLVRAGYLSMTRGDGGQNLIGDEKGDLLGVIRTQELLAARRNDGAEQFFTRALDFGFTKNPEETFSIWNHDQILADVVWVIRKFQPDVIVTRFPITGEGGHGHHTASAILAEEAFDAAADPKRFPEQLAYVKPWQAKRLFWNNWLPQNEKAPPPGSSMLTVDLGRYNALLGKEYTELAAESRSMHKSQGFGTQARRGTVLNYLTLRKGAAAANDLLQDIDLGWSRIAGGEAVGKLVAEANAAFDPRKPEAIVPRLVAIYDAMRGLPQDAHVVEKENETLELIRAASGMWIEAISAQPVVTPGEKVDAKATVVARSDTPLELQSVTIIRQSDGTSVATAANGKLIERDQSATQPLSFEVTSTTPSAPYWLLNAPVSEPAKPAGRFSVADQQLIGLPENPPAYVADFRFNIAGKTIDLTTPVLYRWTDRVRGEQYRALTVAPALTARLDQKVYLYPTAAPHDVIVTVENQTANSRDANVSLVAPTGWKIEPATQTATLAARGGSSALHYKVTPPSNASSATLGVDVRSGDVHESAARSFVVIDYPHIPQQTLFPVAQSRAVRADIKHNGQHIGYIVGSGDEVPAALQQIGYDVHFLSDEEIATGALSGYDAIVTGVRALNVRESAKSHLDRLLQYVHNGGTLVVQYNTADDTLAKTIGPYPLELSQNRVTVEGAPVAIVDPKEPLLNTPNKITAADFEGWVQERGLYFAKSWDPQYRTVMASHDPNESDLPGGLLVANYGKGVYIETGYSFFRQLPAGVPGAFRLFANLVSARQAK